MFYIEMKDKKKLIKELNSLSTRDSSKRAAVRKAMRQAPIKYRRSVVNTLRGQRSRKTGNLINSFSTRTRVAKDSYHGYLVSNAPASKLFTLNVGSKRRYDRKGRYRGVVGLAKGRELQGRLNKKTNKHFKLGYLFRAFNKTFPEALYELAEDLKKIISK